MRKIQLDLSGLRVESFPTANAARQRGTVAANTGNDHCTGPTYVVVTCATCDEGYDTCYNSCGDSCLDTCDLTCGFSCDTCNMSNGKLICPE